MQIRFLPRLLSCVLVFSAVSASAVETALASHAELAAVQVISVAIVHPATSERSASDTHTGDVLEFRKGPNQRFSHHIM